MKSKILTIGAAVLVTVFAMTSCGGQKQVVNNSKTEIFQPFNTPADMSDANFIRATASGTSPDMEMARTIADLNARNQLANQVSSTIKAVTERYMNQVNIADKMEFAQKLEQNVRLVVNQELKGAQVKATKMYQNADGTYECWVNLEMSKDAMMDIVEDVISKDDKLALDFQQHLFRKTFDEEMANFEKNR